MSASKAACWLCCQKPYHTDREIFESQQTLSLKSELLVRINPDYGDACTSSTDLRQDQLRSRSTTQAASGAAVTLAATQKQLRRTHSAEGGSQPDLSHAPLPVCLCKHIEMHGTYDGGCRCRFPPETTLLKCSQKTGMGHTRGRGGLLGSQANFYKSYRKVYLDPKGLHESCCVDVNQ